MDEVVKLAGIVWGLAGLATKSISPGWQVAINVYALKSYISNHLTPTWAYDDRVNKLRSKGNLVSWLEHEQQKDALIKLQDAYKEAFPIELMTAACLASLMVMASVRSGSMRVFVGTLTTTLGWFVASCGAHYALIAYDWAPYTHSIVSAALCVVLSCLAVAGWRSLPPGAIDRLTQKQLALHESVTQHQAAIEEQRNVHTEHGEVLEHLSGRIDQLDAQNGRIMAVLWDLQKKLDKNNCNFDE